MTNENQFSFHWWFISSISIHSVKWQFFLTNVCNFAPLVISAIMRTLTVHCQWEDERVRERIGYLPSYAEAEKMKSLAQFPIHSCLRASCSSSPSSTPSSSFSAVQSITKGCLDVLLLLLLLCLSLLSAGLSVVQCPLLLLQDVKSMLCFACCVNLLIILRI